MLTEIEETKDNAATDRLVRIESIGQSAESRDIKWLWLKIKQVLINILLKQHTHADQTRPDAERVASWNLRL